MRTTSLALRRIVGHCTVTSRAIHAWYLLAPQGWSFRPDAVREQFIVDAADTYAQLVGRQLHLRVTTRPYPVSRWAQDHDRNAPARRRRPLGSGHDASPFASAWSGGRRG